MAEKRKRPASMTAKARAVCKAHGWHYGAVEQQIPGTFIKRDLFNMIDAIVLIPGHRLVGLQVTSGAHHAERETKILENPLAMDWLSCGGTIEVWSWSKTKPRGQKRATWTMRASKLTPQGRFIDWTISYQDKNP